MGVVFGAYVRVTLTSSDGFNVTKGYSDLAGAAASSNVIFDIGTFYLLAHFRCHHLFLFCESLLLLFLTTLLQPLINQLPSDRQTYSLFASSIFGPFQK